MKRDWLKNLKIEVDGKEVNLTDAIIDSIISENGKDIEATKAKADKTQEIENLKSELKTKDEQLANINSEMEKFKTMDIEGIKNKVTELENKNKEYETQLVTEREANEKKIQEQQYDFKLNEYVNGQKFTSEFAKKAYLAELKAQGFKLDADGNFLGANEYTEKFKAANQGVFVVEEAPKDPTPEVVLKPTNTQPQGKKIGLMEMMKLKNSNPDANISFNQE